MRRSDGELERLRALVDGAVSAHFGANGASALIEEGHAMLLERAKLLVCRVFGGWARRVSNLRPLACEE
jgi:hypothetical protein